MSRSWVSRELVRGLLAPLERCLDAALEDLGLEAVDEHGDWATELPDTHARPAVTLAGRASPQPTSPSVASPRVASPRMASPPSPKIDERAPAPGQPRLRARPSPKLGASTRAPVAMSSTASPVDIPRPRLRLRHQPMVEVGRPLSNATVPQATAPGPEDATLMVVPSDPAPAAASPTRVETAPRPPTPIGRVRVGARRPEARPTPEPPASTRVLVPELRPSPVAEAPAPAPVAAAKSPAPTPQTQAELERSLVAVLAAAARRQGIEI